MKGKFIVLEGPDGSGKTTQFELLKKIYPDAVFLREPGGTIAGEKIREILLSKEEIPLSSVSEMLLYAAARAQLIEEVILPGLIKGKLIICDRFLLSSLVYQGIERGLGIDLVNNINQLGLSDIHPDLTFYLDISKEDSRLCRHERNATDRFESETDDFHDRIIDHYNNMVKKWNENEQGKILKIPRMDKESISKIIHMEIAKIWEEK